MQANPPEEHIEQLTLALRGLFNISQVQAFGAPTPGVEFAGALLQDADDAYPLIRDRFAQLGYTAFLSQVGPTQIVQATQGVIESQPFNPLINLILFLLTVLSTLLMGALQETNEPVSGYGDLLNLAVSMLAHPTRLLPGIPFAFTVMAILGTHEMGHYIVARKHKANVSLPYFIPLPFTLFGTMGAVIVQRSPFEDRKSLFDVGLAGPLSGLVVAIPLLIIGLTASTVQPYSTEPGNFFEGNSLLYVGLKYLVHGKLLPANGVDVYLSSMALAAWFGLIVTFLNLLPIGQLDGGHVLYALLGRRAWPIANLASKLLLFVGVLGFAGEFMGIAALAQNFWSGWFIWGILTNLMMKPYHPPPLNDLSQLDPKRRAIGLFAIVVFFLIFTRMPFSASPVLF